MSVEELTYDIKRLSTKIEILQNENSSLEKELLISKQSSSGPSKELTTQYEWTRNNLYSARALIVKLTEKYELIKSHLKLERISLNTIKVQMENNIKDIQLDYSDSISKLAEKIIYLQDYIEKISSQFDSIVAKKNADAKTDSDTINTLKSNIMDRDMKNIKLAKDLSILQSESEKRYTEMQASIVASTKSYQELLAKKDNELLAIQGTNELLSDTIAANIAQINTLTTQQTSLQGKVNELTTMNNSLVATTSTVSNKVHSQQVTIKELTQANEAFKLSLLDAENKMQRAMTLNESLQGDMKAMLTREQTLRSEIGSTNVDKQEVYSRLASITSKLKSIEDDHKQEVDKLTEIIERLEREAVTTDRNCVQYKTMYDELQQLTAELKEVIQTKDNQIANLTSAQASVSQEIYKLKSEIEKLTSECTNLRSNLETIREERDDAHGLKSKALDDLKMIQSKLDKALIALKEGEKERQTLSTQLSQCNPQMIPQLEDALRSINQQLKDEKVQREREVEGLKDTIRRECEERVELLLEIGDLKDQLLRWAGGSGGRRGGGVDANHQTTQLQNSSTKNNSNEVGLLGSKTASSRLTSSSQKELPPMDSSNSSYSMGIVDSLDKTISSKQNSIAFDDREERNANDINWSEKFMKNPTAIAMNNKRHKRK